MLGTGAFFDNGAFPFGGGQLGRIVLVVVDDLHAVQLGRSAAQLGHEPLVDRVEVSLEEGVVVGWIVRELVVVAVPFAHEDVNLFRLQDPIEAGQLTEVDLERMRATLFTTAVALLTALVAPTA